MGVDGDTAGQIGIARNGGFDDRQGGARHLGPCHAQREAEVRPELEPALKLLECSYVGGSGHKFINGILEFCNPTVRGWRLTALMTKSRPVKVVKRAALVVL